MQKELNFIYIVQDGDNIESIAKKYGVSAMKILIKNSVSPSMIKKGKILIIY